MTIVNFSHPLTAEQLRQVANLAGQPALALDVIDVRTHFDEARPFAEQTAALLADPALAGFAWEGGGYLVNLPGHAPIAATLLALLHGRAGHFPTVLRLRRVPDTRATTYEVAELLNLDQTRADGRQAR
jgi:hypothetical protein